MDIVLQPSLEIDYPAPHEVIPLGHYTFRIASPMSLVEAEVSVDRGPWQACRHACGMWWYDWSGYAAGEHQVAARGTASDGRVINSTSRRFRVLPRDN